MKRILITLTMLFVLSIRITAQTIVIMPNYSNARGFSEGLSAVEENGKWGFINLAGKYVIIPQYKKARNFHDGLAAVKTENGEWGYITRDNIMVIPAQFGDARDFNEGIAPVRKDDYRMTADGYEGENEDVEQNSPDATAWKYIDKKGKQVIDTYYADAKSFQNGYACVKTHYYMNEWKLINTKGELVSSTIYKYNAPISCVDSIFPKAGGEYSECGFINTKGEWLISPQYKNASAFTNGVAFVEEYGNINHIVDKFGIKLFTFKESVHLLGKGLFLVNENTIYDYKNLQRPYYVEKTKTASFSPVEQILYSPYKNYNNMINSSIETRKAILSDLSTNCWKTYKEYGDGVFLTCFQDIGYGFTALNMQDYICQYVLSQMKEWLKKGEFESLAAYQRRTADEQRQQQMAAYASELINSLLKKGLDKWTLSNYDADHETFALTTDIGQYVIKVPAKNAKAFKEGWNDIKKEVAFAYHDGLSLESVTFYPPSGNDFTYLIDNSLVYEGRDVSVDISGNNLAINIVEQNGNKNVNDKKPVVPKQPSEIDTNIPSTMAVSQSTFAFIIGNELYDKVSTVPYANNDARIFAEYCRRTLGLPERNVKLYENATYGTMLGAVGDIKKIAKVYKGNINVVLYYAGHGIPDEATDDSYLLPVDADGVRMEVCYSLKRLYKELGDLNVKVVICFVDACFSGAQRGNGMLVAARGVAIKAKSDRPTGNTVVFTAATDKQTAYPYEEKGHGMFTYYLLKKLRDTKGGCTLGELGTYLSDEVSKQAVVTNGREQTPIVLTSPSMANSWRTITLK